MIANLGLRLDFYDQNVQYYQDTFSPFRDADNPALINEESASKGRDPPGHAATTEIGLFVSNQ